ncbi:MULTISPECIES: response regulator [Sphingomonas]|uniref:response regulator n=1 Tax=Sphingomonas TaxID=13687 RepID=UPI00082DFF33|nr:response regulator [Sphingomonas pituitosa]
MSEDCTSTVLVVEDEMFVRMIAADALEESGFAVLEAADAMQALEQLAAHRVAVLFTDINMPGEIDGLQLADIVAVRYPHIKVIVTSGRHWLGSEDLPDHGIYLPKPYRADQLTQLVQLQASRTG